MSGDLPAAWEIVARTALAVGDRDRAAEALTAARDGVRHIADPDDAAVVQADIDEAARLLA